ncbi:MAG TPA: DUF4136 domain-containing protein [Xanthomonadales bacterium]|nr:DUF4136 domain-containing protein [Xanthomonadales bacterium]
MSHRNINAFRAGMLSVVFLLLAGCAPTVTVRSDADPSVNFSQYTTFNFFSQLGIEGDGYANLMGQHFREAITQQMQARGLQLSDNPQLQINVSAATDDKIRVNTYQDPYLYGGYYGRGYMGGWGMPMYYGGSTTTVSQYTVADVYIDAVDAGQHKMVWQGVASFTLSEKMQKELRQSVFNTVNEIFTEFPVAAPVSQ